MRVFLDTNVLVSAFTTRGLCADVVRLVLQKHELIVSERVLDELERVLTDKMSVPGRVTVEIIALAASGEVVGESGIQPSLEITDPDDALILATAIASAADVLVTGDRDLLDAAGRVSELAVLSPRQFWEHLRTRRP